MSTCERKYPKSIKKIVVLDPIAVETKQVDLGMTPEQRRTRKVSKVYRPFEAEVHAAALAAQRYSTKYLELHDAANEERKDGSIERAGQNIKAAHKAAWKTLTKASPTLKRQKKLFRQLAQF
jgi:hypothetical protein